MNITESILAIILAALTDNQLDRIIGIVEKVVAGIGGVAAGILLRQIHSSPC